MYDFLSFLIFIALTIYIVKVVRTKNVKRLSKEGIFGGSKKYYLIALVVLSLIAQPFAPKEQSAKNNVHTGTEKTSKKADKKDKEKDSDSKNKVETKNKKSDSKDKDKSKSDEPNKNESKKDDINKEVDKDKTTQDNQQQDNNNQSNNDNSNANNQQESSSNESSNFQAGDTDTAQSQRVVGNAKTHIYHLDNQHNYRMSSGNLVYFNSPAEAEAAGYRQSQR